MDFCSAFHVSVYSMRAENQVGKVGRLWQTCTTLVARTARLRCWLYGDDRLQAGGDLRHARFHT
jgi:hypothetical protein